MKVTRITWFISGILAVAVLAGAVAAEPAAKPPMLSATDRSLLDGLLNQFLFDPKGAQYVRVKTTQRTVWRQSIETQRGGWLLPDEGGKAAKVVFADGESIQVPAPDCVEKPDFVAGCRKRYAEAESSQGPVRAMQQTAAGNVEMPDLALAAWLYRLDQPALAANALAKARKSAGSRFPLPGEDAKETVDARMVRLLKEELAWAPFAGLVHAYVVRADDEALAHGERLLRLYPDAVKKRYPQGETIVAELKRRKAKGTFGKVPPRSLPEGFGSWEQKKKIDWLIDSLDEVDAPQMGQPGGVALGMDRRVAALVAIGEPAVPALIDVVEKDERLTRSVHFWRDFSHDRTVLGVREAALTAVMSILKVQAFSPASTGDNFTRRGPETAAQTAARLREYWKTYGAVPYDERMMKTLTDPKASFAATREAARNLGNLRENRMLGTTVAGGGWVEVPAVPVKQANPAVAKFSNPTVAEAILAAMDRDLAQYDAGIRNPRPGGMGDPRYAGVVGIRDPLYDYYRREIEDSYLKPLVALGDTRITPELARRYQAATELRVRRKYASACYDLGDAEPMKDFAREVEKGSLKAPENRPGSFEKAGTVELTGVVTSLVHARIPECDCALYAMALPEHPYYALTAAQVFDSVRIHGGRDAWLGHPFCLTILRKPLDDTTPTKRTWRIDGNLQRITGPDIGAIRSVPDSLADPATRRDQAEERKCDQVAVVLCDLVLGAPGYSPLAKDADARLAAVKKILDRYQGRFRLLTRTETVALGLFSFNSMFVPDISPLDHPATAEDVEKGRAVFHLHGKGKLAELKLPAVATLRQEKPSKRPPRVLVVQAEVGPDGKTTYGIIGNGDIREAAADALVDINPIAEKKGGKAE